MASAPPKSEHAAVPDARTEEIVRRLRSVEGHVRGIERMVGADAYCMDVLNQILAVQRALGKVSTLLLDRHLHTCATSAIRGENVEERERVLGELLQVFQATAKL
jgi:CsoR family transcriptional regulator, copper-sensing transcriptional repressor